MSGMTRSMPNISSAENIRPQSITTMSSPYSNTYMFLPISPTPPSGMMRSGWPVSVDWVRVMGFLCEGSEETELVGGGLRFRERRGRGGLGRGDGGLGAGWVRLAGRVCGGRFWSEGRHGGGCAGGGASRGGDRRRLGGTGRHLPSPSRAAGFGATCASVGQDGRDE